MATLADELQNDFADSGSEAEENVEEKEDEDMQEADGSGDEADDYETAAKPRDTTTTKDMRGVSNFMKDIEPVLEVCAICRVMQCGRLLMSKSSQQDIKHYQSLPPEQQIRNEGSVEENPEYELLKKANTFSTLVDDHATFVHKYIRDHYSPRFPELETLLPDPLEYAKAVSIIANGPMDKLRDVKSLGNVLNKMKLMTVTTEAVISKGQPLSDAEMEAVLRACDTMIRFEQAKRVFTDYVQSRMDIFAPNLTALIGSTTAAQLLNARGGLTGLAHSQPANNKRIGSKTAGATGLATNVGVRDQGYLYQSELIRHFRPELKKQAMRIVSAKLVLAARVDLVRQSPDGSVGVELRHDAEKRLDKLTEPPPNKGHRALPAPNDQPSKKRGGRRARKAKEQTAMTDLRRAQNRMAFGKEEQEVGYGTGEGTVGLGMIGQASDGRVRALQIDQKTRARLSKKNPGWGGTASVVGGMASSMRGFGSGAGAGNASVLKGHGLRTSGVATSLGSAGTASSLAFTPKQGLELVDPKARAEAERRAKADEDKWFKGGTFTQVGGGAASAVPAQAKDGFKVPQLPMKRKAES